MASDQLVQARDVLEAVRLLRRRGRRRILQQLEEIEPDLAEHVMEELSRQHRALSNSGASAKEVQRLYRQCEALHLVSLLALRQGLVRLWRDQFAGSRLAQLDASLESSDAIPTDHERAQDDEDDPPTPDDTDEPC